MTGRNEWSAQLCINLASLSSHPAAEAKWGELDLIRVEGGKEAKELRRYAGRWWARWAMESESGKAQKATWEAESVGRFGGNILEVLVVLKNRSGHGGAGSELEWREVVVRG